MPKESAALDDLHLPLGSRVAVAMSGGVDSSTVAALLVEAGYEVVGLTARLYDVGDREAQAAKRAGTCCAPDDARDARDVAHGLGVRHFVIDERAGFTRAVIDPFVAAWQQGDTPNPCVLCNQHLKFDRLVREARAVGADALATGHYARLQPDATGKIRLARAADGAKDQSYFLWTLTPDVADFLRFPLGSLVKSEVRAHAERLGVQVARKPESMDVCFVGAGTAAEFVAARGAAMAGELVDLAGTRLGRHGNLAAFTVGQRKGLGLRTAAAASDPVYVVDKHRDGRVVVGAKADLAVASVVLANCTGLGELPAPGRRLGLQARHRAAPVAVEVTERDVDAGRLTVSARGLLAAVARGQSGVLYDGDELVAGGVVIEVGRANPGGSVRAA